ncbi:FAD-dependent oxidoreductase [Neomoorella thermoacetica]|uniref:FAD-dependent oxidoreductase n=1 Tax=Neomoorella thermoacetica TaxID=1525 RepID=UPI0008FB0117|nr:FAD-dependent oxidoreductase [Moorella thermoacetica]APC07939.1 methylenetetrahydrofolate--tRNA-(uracil-5-)-methyltransferase TrmFO [Moorella thermoacetica]
MPRVVVIGGGWAGCAAAQAARQAGAEVTLLERTDMLLGTGLVGGIMRNNGRFTATEEMLALGGGELFRVTDGAARHWNIDFAGHHHAWLYDVTRIEPLVRRALREAGVEVHLLSRVTAVQLARDRIVAVRTEAGQNYPGEAFIDATGTAGPPANCRRYGNGCAMCIYRCPTFGGRIGPAALAGVKEYAALRRGGGRGAISGSCKLHKGSLAPWLVTELEEKGAVTLPLPPDLSGKWELLQRKACQQYALPEYAISIILLDTGPAKLMTPFFPLEILRRIDGLEKARFEDPYAGGIGNSVRFLAMVPRDDALKVEGLANLFCAGERAGPFVGHTEAIVTGTLAGHNAVRLLAGLAPLVLPATLAVGDIIAYTRRQVAGGDGLYQRFTFSGAGYFERMQRLGLYTTDREVIRKRAGDLAGVFSRPILGRKTPAGAE